MRQKLGNNKKLENEGLGFFDKTGQWFCGLGDTKGEYSAKSLQQEIAKGRQINVMKGEWLLCLKNDEGNNYLIPYSVFLSQFYFYTGGTNNFISVDYYNWLNSFVGVKVEAREHSWLIDKYNEATFEVKNLYLEGADLKFTLVGEKSNTEIPFPIRYLKRENDYRIGDLTLASVMEEKRQKIHEQVQEQERQRELEEKKKKEIRQQEEAKKAQEYKEAREALRKELISKYGEKNGELIFSKH